MTAEEFAARAVGVPWVRWRADWRGMDCFGLLVLYFREVLGVELGEVPQTDIAAGFSAARGWVQCEAEPGATAWMAWRDGAPTHCGMLLPDGRVLHAFGGQDHAGEVRATRLSVMRRIYADLRFYRYAPC